MSHLRATSPLRLVVSRLGSRSESSAAAYVSLVTLGGGLVRGDAVSLGVEVGPGAALVLTSQTSTKVFRGEASQQITGEVAGLLVSVPEPVACFRGAAFEQRTWLSLSGSGSVVLVEGFTSGRAAFGDRWDFARLLLRTTLRREGKALFHDATRLDAAEAPLGPRFGPMEAFFTVAAFGPHVLPLVPQLLAPQAPTREIAVAASRVGQSGAVARIAARSPALAAAEVKRRLRNLPEICGGDPWSGRR